MRENDAVHRPMRRSANAIDKGVNGVAQKFETRDERDLQRAARQFVAQLAGMIEDNFAFPSLNERTGVEILYATDPERLGSSHALSANELRLDGRRRSRHDRVPWQVPIITVALDRFAAGFANHVLERRDRLFLRRFCPGHVKDFLFHDRAVQIVDAVAERNLRERQSHRNPISREMIEVIQVNAAYRQVAKLLDG